MVKTEAPAQDVPPIQTVSPKRQPAQRTAPQARRTTIREDMPLYIERDDEFTRESIETRAEPHGPRRRHSFTMEEAENAFLYGMNSAGAAPAQEPAYQTEAQAYGTQPPAYAPETEEIAHAQ